MVTTQEWPIGGWPGRVNAVFEAQHTKKAEKAQKHQQQRLAKARNRLENCLADQPV